LRCRNEQESDLLHGFGCQSVAGFLYCMDPKAGLRAGWEEEIDFDTGQAG